MPGMQISLHGASSDFTERIDNSRLRPEQRHGAPASDTCRSCRHGRALHFSDQARKEIDLGSRCLGIAQHLFNGIPAVRSVQGRQSRSVPLHDRCHFRKDGAALESGCPALSGPDIVSAAVGVIDFSVWLAKSRRSLSRTSLNRRITDVMRRSRTSARTGAHRALPAFRS